MFKVNTSIYLSLPPEDVFKILTDIGSYPEIFPFYVETEKIMESAGSSTWKNVALMHNARFSVKGNPFIWYSEYTYNQDKLRINAAEIGPKSPLKKLNAEWHLNKEGDGTKVILIHYFDIKNVLLISKYILNIIVRFIINSNAQKLLKKLKDFDEQMFINNVRKGER